MWPLENSTASERWSHLPIPVGGEGSRTICSRVQQSLFSNTQFHGQFHGYSDGEVRWKTSTCFSGLDVRVKVGCPPPRPEGLEATSHRQVVRTASRTTSQNIVGKNTEYFFGEISAGDDCIIALSADSIFFIFQACWCLAQPGPVQDVRLARGSPHRPPSPDVLPHRWRPGGPP